MEKIADAFRRALKLGKITKNGIVKTIANNATKIDNTIAKGVSESTRSALTAKKKPLMDMYKHVNTMDSGKGMVHKMDPRDYSRIGNKGIGY